MFHSFSFLLSVAALSLLVVFSSLKGEPTDIVSYSLFGASLVGFYGVRLLLMSRKKPPTAFLERIDHALIYSLTASTYTAVALQLPSSGWAWSIFGVVWALSLIAIVLRLANQLPPSTITIGFYGLLLIVDIVAFQEVHAFLNPESRLWFTIGAILFLIETAIVVKRPKIQLALRFGKHENLAAPFALAGSLSHFFALLILLP